MAAQAKRKRTADLDSGKRLDAELTAWLSGIRRYDPPPQFPAVPRSRYIDDRGVKVFAVNMARILHHHGLSVERAAKLLRTSPATLIRWLTARGKRPAAIIENMSRHLGVGGWELVERILPFREIETVRLGEGWLPSKGWGRPNDPAEPVAVNSSDDDDDPANWWKAGV